MKVSSVVKPSCILHRIKEFAFNAGSQNKSLHRGQLSLHPSLFPFQSGQIVSPPEGGWIPTEAAFRVVILPESTLCLFLVCLFSFLESFFWTEGAKPCWTLQLSQTPVLNPHFHFIYFFKGIEPSWLWWTFSWFTVEGGSLSPGQLLTFCC